MLYYESMASRKKVMVSSCSLMPKNLDLIWNSIAIQSGQHYDLKFKTKSHGHKSIVFTFNRGFSIWGVPPSSISVTV